MKNTCFDQETNKNYSYENDYDFQIQQFAELKQHYIFDDPVVDFALKLKESLVKRLKMDKSNHDMSLVKFIHWIENKYLTDALEFAIQKQISHHPKLQNYKSYKYNPNKKSAGRPKGSKNKLTYKKYNWVRDRYYKLMKNLNGQRKQETAKLIRSELLNNKPDWWSGKTFSIETIKDIIKRQKWSD